MAGLLLELRRQIAKNHRKGIYGNASVQRRETPNMKDSVPKRNSMADMHQGKMSEKVLQQKEQGVDVKNRWKRFCQRCRKSQSIIFRKGQ